ncbi:MAG: histidine phosphatase family protein [Pseudomonadota bacterium]
MRYTLILMRHAKSSWDDPMLADHDRPLNKRGRASARAMGDWLREIGEVPDACISSDSARTQETFKQLQLDIPLRVTNRLYHAGPSAILAELRRETQETVLVIGHNPGIAELAEGLVKKPPQHDRFEDYPTCATTVIRFETSRWNDIGWHSGQPIQFAIPRDVM